MVALIKMPEITQTSSQEIPPLNNGDHLSWAEFRRRYETRPDIKKAELIEGVVYIMPSPIHHRQHSYPHAVIVGWLINYAAATPGVDFGDNATVELDGDNEVQPDALLRLEEELGGRCHITVEDYLAGPPELVVEVATTSAAYDLHNKLRVYQENGVQEYLVLLTYEQRALWHILQEGIYEIIPADNRGVLRSQVFPGLHFHPEHFWTGDLAGLLMVLHEGLESPEHAEFVARLGQVRSGRT